VAIEPRIPETCLSFPHSGMWIRGVPEPEWYASKRGDFATNKWAYVSYFDTCTQYHLVCFDCHMGWANMKCWISHEDMPRILRCTGTSTIGQQILRLCHEYPDPGTQYCLVCFDWQMGLANMLCWICHDNMPWIIQGTGVSWAHIVMTDRLLHSCLSHLI